MKIPNEWTFEDKEIAQSFDAHVREQLPWYELATGAVAHIARHYIPQDGLVYDIGASTGNIGRSIESVLIQRNARLISIEASKEMCDIYSGPQPEELQNCRAESFQYESYDLAICFLSLMFIPVESRIRLIRKLKYLAKPGAALIIFDKQKANTGYIGTIMWRLALAGKVAANVDTKEIIQKELSLCGIQRPLDVVELGPGFIEWFKFGEFTGWIFENERYEIT